MLARKQTPLTAEEARHLLARTGFGAPAARVVEITGVMPEQVVESMIDDARALLPPPAPSWTNEPWPGSGAPLQIRQQFFQDNGEWLVSLLYDWVSLMASAGFRERLVLFWHNHFVTSFSDYTFAALSWRYLQTLRTHALGNFRTFVRAVGTDGAMLRYLNGHGSTYLSPNENYARELLELFTMGPEDDDNQPNYTEDDIRDIARALTGFRVNYETWESEFNAPAHDTEEKLIFGVEGTFGYDEVVDLIFAERSEQIARFMSRKFIAEFVHPDVDEAAVSDLAETFLASDFSIAEVLRDLLASEMFYDPSTRGARIKSPAELVIGPFVDREQPVEGSTAIEVTRALFGSEQRLLAPPNVAGWPGHRDWLTTSTLPVRLIAAESAMTVFADASALTSLAENIHDPQDPYASLRLPTALADHLFSIPLEWIEIPEDETPFAGNLDANPLPDWFLNGPRRERDLVRMFLGTLPWYEWHLYRDGAADRIAVFLRQLTSWPEYQLI
ncbi:MAG: DUF1800 domain-containing protein [Rhodothermales bacterium]|nr:DUF1800 domain-containing protein [Rhodothermales bacterium]